VSAILRQAAESVIAALDHLPHWRPSMAAHLQNELRFGLEAEVIVPPPLNLNVAAVLNVLDRCESSRGACAYCHSAAADLSHKQGCPLFALLTQLRALPEAPCANCDGTLIFDPANPTARWCVCGNPSAVGA